MNANEGGFYVTNGTVGPESHSYVKRRADVDLFEGLARGEFCYVLTSRQMGKSSLSVRVADRLREAGCTVARVDLTRVGSHSVDVAEKWYDGLLYLLGEELDLEAELGEAWRANLHLPLVLRFMTAIESVVLERSGGPVVIFIDEIDTVRSLPFSTDEFFAAIRECFNRRVVDEEMRRMTFCLLGVASPADLIQDTRTTPFNIGRRIELADFTAAECLPLSDGLGREPEVSRRLLRRVYYWTHGHPYLTQRLCRAIAEDPAVVDARGVDCHCGTLFLARNSRGRDDNLLFVRERLLRGDDATRDRLLDLYAKVRSPRRVWDDEADPSIEILRLSGITRVVEGRLKVRNRIYARVFDRTWTRSNRPKLYRRAFLRGVALTTFASILILGAIGGYAFYRWDAYHRGYVEYFNTFAKRHGTYVGIGPISEGQRKHRPATYKFSRKGRLNPVEKVQAIAADGSPTYKHAGSIYLDLGGETAEDDPNRWTCQWEFVRDASGRVVSEVGRDRSGKMTWSFIYSPSGPDGDILAHFIGGGGFPQTLSGSSADYVQIHRDANGDEEVIRFFDREGRRNKNQAGIYGASFKFNPLGFPREVTYLGRDDKPEANRSRIVQERRTFDPLGNVLEESYHDADGRVIVCSRGYSKALAAYDSDGNLSSIKYFDRDGKPAMHRDGYSMSEFNRDAAGQVSEVAFFDGNGGPARLNGYSKLAFQYDASGNEILRTFLDEMGRPARYQGVTAVRQGHEERGLATRLENLDDKGRLVRDGDGIARRDDEFDELGHVKKRLVFDDSGQAARFKEGNYGWAAVYNPRGKIRETTYLGPDGKAARNYLNYAIERMKYDDRDLPTQKLYLDEKGEPAPHPQENYGWRADYDERGNEISRDFLGIDQRPSRTPAGNAGWRARYDGQDRQIELQYVDEGGKNVRLMDSGMSNAYDASGRISEQTFWSKDVKDGLARMTFKFDDRGRATEGFVLDEAGKPARHKDGYARVVREHDLHGNIVKLAYFDELGHAAHHKDGNTGLTNTYDIQDRLIETEYWGFDASFGFSKAMVKFDGLNRVHEYAFFDEFGKPSRHKDGHQGFTNSYDKAGKLVAKTFWGYDAGTLGYARLSQKLDARGNVVEVTLLNDEGRPARHKDGYRGFTNEFDNEGKLIASVVWGWDAGSVGYTKQASKLDNRGSIIEAAYLDDDGKPTRHKDGNRGLTNSYDDQGKLVATLFWGYEAGLMGFAKQVLKLDARGKIAEVAYLDDDGRPARHKDGNRGFSNEYDEKGERIANVFWGYDADTLGYARKAQRFDARGNVAEVAFLDEDGRPARHKDGYRGYSNSYGERNGLFFSLFDNKLVADVYWGYDASQVGYAKQSRKFDARGNIAEVAYLDDDGKPARHKDGYRGFTNEFDGQGRRVANVLWGFDDGTLGYARKAQRFDALGNVVEAAYLDDDGKAARHKDGYQGYTDTFDEQGKLVSDVLWGYDSAREGYAKHARKYDARGNIAEVAYLDDAGQPARNKDGYRGFTNTLDGQGHIVERVRWGFDPAGGYSRSRFKYDARGRIAEVAYLDDDGKPARHGDGYRGFSNEFDDQGRRVADVLWGFDAGTLGYSRKSQRFDARGKVVEAAYLDDDGKPARHKEGNRGFTNTYDDRGQLVERVQWGYDPAWGFSRARFKYDARGKIAEVAYLDEAVQPARHKDGYRGFSNEFDDQGKLRRKIRTGYDGSRGFASEADSYDDRGNVAETSFLDTEGHPTLADVGFARSVRKYSPSNELIDFEYFDLDGKPVRTRVVFTEILPDGEAAKLGLRAGDVVLGLEGNDRLNRSTFAKAVRSDSSGPRELRVRRGPDELTFQVPPGLLNVVIQDRAVKDIPPNEAGPR